MDEQYYADRAQLRHLMQTQPALSIREQMTVTGRSRSWVKKWRKRLREAPPEDKQVLHGHSRAPHCPPAKVSEVVVQRILAIRDQPPSHLQRIPGPKAILHDLHQDAVLAVFEVLPRAPSTIWRILRRHGRIPPKLKRPHEPLPRPAPMTQWQVDFKDISTVKPDPEGDGKCQHVVEALNLVDAGTSILVDYRLRADFNAATVIEAMAECLQERGLPQAVTFDRDPRFVGSWSGQDFPAAWIRFWHALGVRPITCPPRRPDKNPFVERYHRTYQAECLAIHRPASLEQAEQVTAPFARHYNEERPNQALSCGNRPPKVAFADLPPCPALPAQVTPDAWLYAFDGRAFVRRVSHNGTVKVDNHAYYIQQALKGRKVTLEVEAGTRQFVVLLQGQVLKRLPIQGLHPGQMTLHDYVALICQEANREWRRHLRSLRRVTIS